MDYATLKSLKPSEFTDAADGYRATSDMAGKAKEHIENEITVGMRQSLESKAATTADSQLRKLAQNFHYTQVECGLISTALNGLAHDLEAAQKKLKDAVTDAQSKNFTVEADGSVSYPAAEMKTDGKAPGDSASSSPSTAGSDMAQALQRQAASVDPNPNYGPAQEIANRISAAIQEAAEADAKWAPKLRALKADDDLQVSYKDWANVQKDTRGVLKGADTYMDSIKEPPKNGSPKENAEWWKGLSQDEREGYATLHPASIGALDGIPSDVRDTANRTVLAEQRAKYELALQSFPPMPQKYQPPTSGYTIAYMEWAEKRERLTSAIRGMEVVQERLDRRGPGQDQLPPAYLLGFDTKGEGDGRVIIANGNPDTADHTAIYVPGTGSDLAGIRGDIERGERLWAASDAKAPGQSVSTITWLDYDTPRSAIPVLDGDLAPQAAFPQYAEDAAPRLNQFLEGTQEAQGGYSSSHTTVIGHSYGSTVVGEASKQGDLAAEDIVVAGSPGMQVRHANDLDVDQGHVWAMAGSSSKDQVPVGGKIVGLGEDWTVPTDPKFGAHIMETDSEDHSGYWQPGSTSLRNQAAVITGEYGEVKQLD
ncbi:alpha/beta hydrolase [Streptomyces monticola]|uniref:Alpha/beta hydrolase n=1 Tax=Streptomyces monticola TaxID=2666263 RepID=A0ABW2JI18_9ACTN